MITLDIEWVKEFISTFSNAMGVNARQHGCEIILPFADGLKSGHLLKTNLIDVGAITNVLECCLEQLEKAQSLSFDIVGQEKRMVSCRIIVDYETWYEQELGDETECGPSISSIDRIRWKVPAEANTIILGDEFYKAVESFPVLLERYRFERKDDCIMNNIPYPIYQLYRMPH